MERSVREEDLYKIHPKSPECDLGNLYPCIRVFVCTWILSSVLLVLFLNIKQTFFFFLLVSTQHEKSKPNSVIVRLSIQYNSVHCPHPFGKSHQCSLAAGGVFQYYALQHIGEISAATAADGWLCRLAIELEYLGKHILFLNRNQLYPAVLPKLNTGLFACDQKELIFRDTTCGPSRDSQAVSKHLK